MQAELDLSGRRAAQARPGRRPVAAWIIGVLSVVLLGSGSAFGQLVIQPMKVELGVQPGKRFLQKLVFENLNANASEKVDFRIVGVTQDSDGIWQVIEPDTPIVEDPNGARWVTVRRSGQEEIRLDIQRLRSCQDWLRLDQGVMEVGPLQRRSIGLHVTVPPGKRGYYCAALMAVTNPREGLYEGVTTPVIFHYVIPVIIEVQGRPVRHEVKLTDVGLRFQPQQEFSPAATFLTLGIDNPGGTYSRLIGVARLWRKTGENWRKITEQRFRDTGIIPGVTLNLKQDVGRALPSGKYKVQGYMFVDGQRGGMVEKEIDFAGDSRVVESRYDASLQLDPPERVIETFPGAMRTGTMRVVNASEDEVIVDVEAVLPEDMRQATITDPLGLTMRADQMGCGDWLQVSPKRFTLRGYGQRNLRIKCKMPESAARLPNHYATILLKASYPNGEPGGVTEGRVYVTTRGVQVAPRIIPTMLNVVETSTLRYLIRAQFSNAGLTHVLPRCRAVLTTKDPPRQVRKRIPLSSADLGRQTGNMLPCEKRLFSGVLDMSEATPGEYLLTAVLEYGAGDSEQKQIVLTVTEVGGQKSVEVTEAIGEPVRIEL